MTFSGAGKARVSRRRALGEVFAGHDCATVVYVSWRLVNGRSPRT
jgi:hypothetical protein